MCLGKKRKKKLVKKTKNIFRTDVIVFEKKLIERIIVDIKKKLFNEQFNTYDYSLG